MPDLASLDDLALRLTAGASLPSSGSLPARCRRAIAIATDVGAPLLDAVDAARAAEEDTAAARRAVAVASSQARTVAAALLAAPFLVTPVLARIVDIDLVGFFTTPIGAMVLAVATALYIAGAYIVVTLVRRASSPRLSGGAARGHGALILAGVAGVAAWAAVGPVLAPIAALVTYHLAGRPVAHTSSAGADEAVDLVATALHGAVGVPEAVRLVAGQLPAFADELRGLAWELQVGRGPAPGSETPLVAVPPRRIVAKRRTGIAIPRLAPLLRTAEETGAAVAPTLRRLARQLRADVLAERLSAAERLPAQLTFPTALLLLPATVLLIGAPILHAGWTAAGW